MTTTNRGILAGLVLTMVVGLGACSRTPSWLDGAWELSSYGEPGTEGGGHPFASALAQRFYWRIDGDRIEGYAQPGWDGTLTSLFYTGESTRGEGFELKSELRYRILSSSGQSCEIEFSDGTFLDPITSMVTRRGVRPAENLVARRLDDRRIALDWRLDPNDQSVRAQARRVLCERSSSLVAVDGETVHRLVLVRSRRHSTP